MPSPNEKNKKRKSIRTPGGVTKTVYVKKKTKKDKCSLCSRNLNGMPHGKRPFEVKKLKKTQRRPENLLASVVCPVCRDVIYQEAVMLKYSVVETKDIDTKHLKYIDMIKKRIK